MKKRWSLALLLCLGMLGTSAQVQAQTVDWVKVIDGMQAYYEQATSYSANFDQTYTSIDGVEKLSKGVVWFRKPGMMRWDYSEPEERYLISDGKTFWSWEPTYRQYCKQDLSSSQLPTALTFLTGEGDLKKEYFYSVTTGDDGLLRVSLTPIVPTTQYLKLEMAVDPTSYRVERVVVHDTMGNVNTLRFSSAELNGELDLANFSFSPPDDAQEICK